MTDRRCRPPRLATPRVLATNKRAARCGEGRSRSRGLLSGGFAPQFPAREPRAVGERLELHPDDARMHFAGRGKACKAAIGAGYDILAPDCLRKPADALGDQLGMLDDIR